MRNEKNNTTEVIVFEDIDELYDRVAAQIGELAAEAHASRGQFLFVLAGGETPKPLYQRLAKEPLRSRIPWEQTHLYWGDERAVPPNDPQSNFGMAQKYLLHGIPLPDDHVHRIKGELGAVSAAREYANELRAMSASGLAWPRFDLVLLGLGSDGHTASLFPGSTHPSRSEQATLAVNGSYDQRPTSRITLTPPVFNSARQIYYLVIGKRKAETLAKVLEGKHSPVRYPARRIKPDDGRLTWFVDRDAASNLTQRAKHDSF